MSNVGARRVGILWRGARDSDAWAMPFAQRLRPVFDALLDAGIEAEPVVFDDEFADELRLQLLRLDCVLVWVDPVMGDRTRIVLDALLREVAANGVWVSAHPDVIEKIGTKEILVRTRDEPFGSDTHIYRTVDEFRVTFPGRVAADGPRVLKPYKGNAGIGVWKVQLTPASDGSATPSVEIQDAHPRGTDVETLALPDFMRRWETFFDDGGGLVDQPFHANIAAGMVRCYLVRDKVAGFALQEPDAAQLASKRVFGLPSKKILLDASEPRFSGLRAAVEATWLPALLKAAEVSEEALPFLWDADFFIGDGGIPDGAYVLCEINVSSVIPFPPAAPSMIANAIANGSTNLHLTPRI